PGLVEVGETKTILFIFLISFGSFFIDGYIVYDSTRYSWWGDRHQEGPSMEIKEFVKITGIPSEAKYRQEIK
ncbi:MAG: hypothetical protein ACE5K3_07525, partial [bacterium]